MANLTIEDLEKVYSLVGVSPHEAKELLTIRLAVLLANESTLEEVYEHVFGDDAINRYTPEELITMLDEMYDCYKYVVDNVYSKGKHIGEPHE